LKDQIQKNFERVSYRINEIKVKDDIYVPYDEADPIFELTNQIGKEFMEATEGPEAVDSCACCNN
jgi:hypothetical protein